MKVGVGGQRVGGFTGVSLFNGGVGADRPRGCERPQKVVTGVVNVLAFRDENEINRLVPKPSSVFSFRNRSSLQSLLLPTFPSRNQERSSPR